MMMVHRTRGDRGKLQIDIRLPGFGRFRKSAGTTRAIVAKRRIALLRRLADNGQLETLRLIHEGTISWPHVEQAAKKNRLENAALLSDLLVDANLQQAIDATLHSMGKAPGTRTRYDLALRQLAVLGVLTPDARVRDLLRDDWLERFKAWDVAAATKNGVRRAVSRFLTRYLGDKHHEFRRQVLHEDRWPKVDEPRRIRGFAVEQFWPLMTKVPQHLVSSYVLLAATGMRVGEFLNDDAIALDEINRTITVTGKTGQQVYAVARPVWPFVKDAVPCRVARRRGATPPATIQEDPRYKKLYRRLRDAGDAIGVKVTIHDLRRLFARLGVASDGETATQTAMGHKTASMTREYARWNTQHEVAASVAQALGLGDSMSGKKSGNSKRNKAARGGTR